MLFNVAFIFGLFVVTSVGATGSSSPPNGKGKAASPKTRILKEGEIVEIFTGRLKSYVYQDLKPQPSYLLAVFVRYSIDDRRYGTVVPVIPKSASPEIFPSHLRRDVKEYFDGRYPIIKGFGQPVVLNGDFELAIDHRVDSLKLRPSSEPTIMGDENRKELIAEFTKNIGMQGMPPLPLEVDLTRADARNTETIKIQPGQVVKFDLKVEGQFKGPSVLGVAVCWTGQGKIAIIPILKEDSEKSEVIDASDFHGLPENTVGKYDLVALRFINYKRLTPQPATFHNKHKLDELVEEILKNMKTKKAEAARVRLRVQSGVPDEKRKAINAPWRPLN